jgi:type I restriction enzyme S subunit
MNAQSFLDNFQTIARAPGGVSRVRDMVYFFAITGGLSCLEAGDSDAKLILDNSLQAKLDYYEEHSVRQGARKHSDIFQVVKRVPSHWVTVAAGDLVHLINGRAFKATDWKKKTGLPIIRIQNLNNPTALFNYFQGVVAEGHQIATGDMLLSWSGTPGTSFGAFIWNGGDAVLNQHIFKVAIYSSKISKEYLRMAINASLDALIGSARGGVGLKHVTKGQIESLQVPVPPMEEQKRIVAKVDELMRLCDRLETQQQEREKLLPQLSRVNHTRFVSKPTASHLHSLFHQPRILSVEDLRNMVLTLGVSGQLTQRLSDDESARSLLIELREQQSLLHQLIVGRNRTAVSNTVLPRWAMELPESWESPLFDDVFVITSGITKGRNLAGRRTVSLPYLRVANVQRWHLSLEQMKDIEVLEEERERYRLLRGDVVMIEGGDWDKLGRAAIWNEEIKECVFQNHIFRVRSPDKTKLLPEWVVMFINSPIGREYFESCSKQTTNLASINMTQLRACRIPLPSTAEQKRIVHKVNYLLALVDKLAGKKSIATDTAHLFATAAIAVITTTEFTEKERMKPPKTEVVTVLKVGSRPKKSDAAPLASLLSEQKAEASAKTLWQLSGLEIDAFYRQLKTEMANGWIDEDKDKRAVHEVEDR